MVPRTNDQPTDTELPGSTSPGSDASRDETVHGVVEHAPPAVAEQDGGPLPPPLPVPLWPPPPPHAMPGSHWSPPADGEHATGGHANGFNPLPRTRSRRTAPLDALGRPIASWPKRTLAFLVDFFLLSLLLNWFGHVVFPNLLSSSAAIYRAVPESQELSFLGVSFLVWVAYLTFLASSRRGQTLGMMLYGIAVRDVDGGPVKVGRATIRSVILIVASGFLIDVFWPLWDPRRQALHDKPAHTLVIDMRLAALMQQLPPDRR